MICHRFFLKHFSLVRYNSLTKVTLVSFPQKSSFRTIVQFGPKFIVPSPPPPLLSAGDPEKCSVLVKRGGLALFEFLGEE